MILLILLNQFSNDNFNMDKLITLINISDIISILALLLSAYALRKTNQFNKKQESLINSQNEINNLMKEKELKNIKLEKQADLNMNLVLLGTKNRRVRVFNKGQAPAYHVELIIPEDNHLLLETEVESVFPLEILEPNQSVNLIISTSLGTGRKNKFKLVWQDEFSSENSKTIYLTT